MKLFKNTLIALVTLVLLTGIAIFLLTKNITPSAIKNIINKELTSITTQNTHIDGEIVWQLFPRPGIKVTQIHVGEEDNKSKYNLYIDNILFNVQITPLLRGHLVFNELKVDGLKITIHPEAQTSVTTSMATVSQETNAHRQSEPMSAQFAINSFLLTRGQLIIIQPHGKISLTNLQIGAKELNLKNEFFPLQIRTSVAASIADNNIKTTLNYKGRIRLAPSTLAKPLMALQHVAIDGQLSAQNSHINQFKIAKISSNAISKSGAIVLNPLNFSLYAGQSVGDLKYHIATNKLSINQTATSLDAAQLFNDLSAKNVVKGNLDVSVHATTNLADNHWQNNLQGNGSLTMKDGTLNFIDLNKLIDEMINKIHELPSQVKKDINQVPELVLFAANATQEGSTKFQLLSTQYRLMNGKLINDSILLQTDKLQLKGNSQLDMVTNTLDGTLFAKIITKDNTIDSIQQLLGGSFPLKLSGTFARPMILPNVNEINPIIAKYILQKSFEKPIKQLKQQIESMIATPENLLQQHPDNVE